MKAEVISIGSELTSGQNLDTNSQWLSRRLALLGVDVRWHTTLADDLEENIQAFGVARDRAHLVIITGGLGPTQDDLTRDALAQLAGVELIFHESSFEFIRQLFARRGRVMPERNRVQALFPVGAEPISNTLGTAPGIWMAVEPRPTLFIAMPGVPGEMHAMFENEVTPKLLLWLKATVTSTTRISVILERKVNCFGAGESAVEQRVLDLTRRGHVPEVGITVSDATISLRILARAESVEAAQRQIEPVERTIRERLGELVFGVEDEDLQHAVIGLLRDRHRTLAVAEGVTGGLIAHRLTAVPGGSQNFRGGVVAYHDAVKVDQLALPQRLIDEHGVVSAKAAEALAVACRIRFRADLALSTVGLAGPIGGENTPTGLVFVALAAPNGVQTQSFHWPGSRHDIQSRTAKMALNLARLWLLKN